jgi:hypothetical protein
MRRKVRILSQSQWLKTPLPSNRGLLETGQGGSCVGFLFRCYSDPYMSSSDETIFGDAFFEPIAKAVSGGTVASHEAIDVVVETETTYKPIAVKSSPNIFNASQAKRMDDEFRKLRSRLQKIQKHFDPLLGHCYGRVNTDPAAYIYRRRSGQVFWEELTGDPDFFLKLIRLMKDYPIAHRLLYREEYDKAVNRFTKAFLDEFANADGGIDWDKLVKFNSGKEQPKRVLVKS